MKLLDFCNSCQEKISAHCFKNESYEESFNKKDREITESDINIYEPQLCDNCQKKLYKNTNLLQSIKNIFKR